MVKKHTECRVCGSTNLIEYLNLGLMPLANNLTDTKEKALASARFPLEVMYCEKCFLSQLSIVVEPKTLYSNYVYRSSISETYKKHCQEMTEFFTSLNKDSFVVDIAGNDGTLLQEFKKKFNCQVLNVDPAMNLCQIAAKNGIPSLVHFFDDSAADQILASCDKADFVTATNVFAHVDDPLRFLQNVKRILKPNGKLLIEVPEFEKLLERKEFDTIYFEHLSYFDLSSIEHLLYRAGLCMLSYNRIDIHGGSLRIVATHNKYVPEFQSVRPEIQTNILTEWATSIKQNIVHLKQEIIKLKKRGRSIAAFGASAKGNTLLNSAGIDFDLIDYIVDDTPEKIGKFQPGTGLEIVTRQQLTDNPPDYLLLLAWNFADEIMQKLDGIYKGAYIVPIPEFNIIESRAECLAR